MKHLLLFEAYQKLKTLNNSQESFLRKSVVQHGFTRRMGSWSVDYSQNPPLVNVIGDVRFQGRKTLSGVHFGKVDGDFIILRKSSGNTKFESTKGFPIEVTGKMDIFDNPFGTLKDLPTKKVGESFCAVACELKTLTGCPQEVGGDLILNGNYFRTLEGAPQIMKDDATVSVANRGGKRPLLSLEGLPPNLDPNNIETHKFYSWEDGVPEDFLRDGYREFKKTGSWIPYYIKLDAEYGDKGFYNPEFINQKLDPTVIQKFIDQTPEKALVALKPYLRKMKEDPRYSSIKFPENLEKEKDLLSDLEDVGL
jgi:hypothetical protein